MRYRGRAPVIAVATIALLALLVPVLPLADPLHIDVAHHLAPPSLAHLLGQDEYGRDVLSRLLWGARISLAVAGGSASLAPPGISSQLIAKMPISGNSTIPMTVHMFQLAFTPLIGHPVWKLLGSASGLSITPRIGHRKRPTSRFAGVCWMIYSL